MASACLLSILPDSPFLIFLITVWCPTHSEVPTVSWIHHGFLTLNSWSYHLEDFLFCPPTRGLISVLSYCCAWHPKNNCWMKCLITKTKWYILDGLFKMEGNFHTWVLCQFSHSVLYDSLRPHEPQHQTSLSITNSRLLPLSHFSCVWLCATP